MKRLVLIGMAGAVLSGIVLAQDGARQAGPNSGANKSVERGRYLVHHVAMCVQCHSPRDVKGNLDSRRLLTGARIPVASPFPDSVWAFAAPRLTGAPGWTQEEFVALLTTGKRPGAPAPRSPMPKYQMTEEDAAAVYTYLNSLE